LKPLPKNLFRHLQRRASAEVLMWWAGGATVRVEDRKRLQEWCLTRGQNRLFLGSCRALWEIMVNHALLRSRPARRTRSSSADPHTAGASNAGKAARDFQGKDQAGSLLVETRSPVAIGHSPAMLHRPPVQGVFSQVRGKGCLRFASAEPARRLRSRAPASAQPRAQGCARSWCPSTSCTTVVG